MPKNTPEPTPAAETEAEKAAGKGRPTPKRDERVAQRKRPLVPEDRKAARRESRQRLNEQREAARIGMANGDERYLPVRDKGPQKRYIRDFVDARWNVGEILLPVMFLVILTYFVPVVEVAFYALIAVWAVIAIVVIDCVILGFQLKKRLTAKFGEGRVEKYRWYAAMRAVQMRPLRLPKPQVARGQYPA